MKFPKEAKVEHIVEKDPTKRVLLNPYLHTRSDGSKVIYVANGSAVVVLPAEDAENDLDGQIPLYAVKEARKQDGSIELTDGYAILPNSAAFPREMQFDSFPPIEQIIPSHEKTSITISIDPKLLYQLSQAMGASVVKLSIQQDPTLPIGVTPHAHEKHIEGAKGAILPYRMPNSL